MKPEDEPRTRDLAWLGDAALALYAREWILRDAESPLGPGRPFNRVEIFTMFTSNNFLSALGQPTLVEAAIGQAYRDGGLDAAFRHITENILPHFEKRLRNETNRVRGGGKK